MITIPVLVAVHRLPALLHQLHRLLRRERLSRVHASRLLGVGLLARRRRPSTYHLFFLYASRALHDPTRRHYRAAIGHAVSTDLVHWERVADALVRGDAPAFDDLATWTGSVVRHPDGRWFMFYTGAPLNERRRQRAVASGTPCRPTSTTGTRRRDRCCEADPRWYEKCGSDGHWHDEAFRDPWVFADPDGDGWHMLITARASHRPAGRPRRRRPRLVGGPARLGAAAAAVGAGAGFGQLEVFQIDVVDGRQVLLFNCLVGDMPEAASSGGVTGGVWIADAKSPLGPYDIAGAAGDRRPVALRRQVRHRARDRGDQVPGVPQRDRTAIHRRDHRPVCRHLGRRPPASHVRAGRCRRPDVRWSEHPQSSCTVAREKPLVLRRTLRTAFRPDRGIWSWLVRRVGLKGCPGCLLVEVVDGVCPILENSTACQKSMPITSSRGVAWSLQSGGLGGFRANYPLVESNF